MAQQPRTTEEAAVFKAGMKEGFRLAIVLMSPALAALDGEAKIRLARTLDSVQDAYDDL